MALQGFPTLFYCCGIAIFVFYVESFLQLLIRVMSRENPINIQSDNEECREYTEAVLKKYKQTELYKAHMVSKSQVMFTVIMFNLSPDKQEGHAKLQEQIKQYFADIIDISQQNFYPRRDADPNQQKQERSIILYGVDFLSNKNIKPMFERLQPKITWIDSSHCKVTFPEPDCVEKAIQQNIQHASTDVNSMDEERDGSNNWFFLKSYQILKFQRKIYCRYATKGDCFDGDRKSPKYIEFKDRKKKYQAEIFENYKDDYERYIRELDLTDTVVTGPRIERNLKPRENNMRNQRWNDHDRNRNRNGDQISRNYNNDRQRSRQKYPRRDYEPHNSGPRRNNNFRNQRQERSRRRSRSVSISSNQNQREESYDFILTSNHCESQNERVNLDISQRNDLSLSIRNDSIGDDKEGNNFDLSISEEEGQKEEIKKVPRQYEQKKNLNCSYQSNKSSITNKNNKKGKKNVSKPEYMAKPVQEKDNHQNNRHKNYQKKQQNKTEQFTTKSRNSDDKWTFQGQTRVSEKTTEKIEKHQEDFIDY